MNYQHLISKIAKSLSSSAKDKESVLFFRRDIVHIFVWIHLLKFYYEANDCTAEQIVSEIPRSYASRPTIFKIIENAILKKYVLKSKNIYDKRKNNLLPSSITIKEFEAWANMFKGF